LRIDAIYVSGGPHDHPLTTGKGRARDPNKRIDEASERHNFEEIIIRSATLENIPLLGVCGGSWRVAATLGAGIERISPDAVSTHAGRMDKPNEKMHTVKIEPASMLDQIIRTDNYRNNWPTRSAKGGEVIELPVNSVHWAQSVFPHHSETVVSARDAKVTEAFETKGRHFQVGIQWHPEYAQNGLEEAGEKYGAFVGEQHRRIMAALGDAATDGRAARILQYAMRKKLAVRLK
jgi:putative glutamine amidotransferase